MAGILASVGLVDALLDEQAAGGIPPENMVLAGFSQGGAIALRCGLARREPLGGLIGLSTYLVDAAGLERWSPGAPGSPPILMGHGSQDPIVPVGLGEGSAKRLKSAGFDVTWRTWPMPHAVCAEEVAAVDEWLEQRWS